MTRIHVPAHALRPDLATANVLKSGKRLRARNRNPARFVNRDVVPLVPACLAATRRQQGPHADAAEESHTPARLRKSGAVGRNSGTAVGKGGVMCDSFVVCRFHENCELSKRSRGTTGSDDFSSSSSSSFGWMAGAASLGQRAMNGV